MYLSVDQVVDLGYVTDERLENLDEFRRLVRVKLDEAPSDGQDDVFDFLRESCWVLETLLQQNGLVVQEFDVFPDVSSGLDFVVGACEDGKFIFERLQGDH